MPDENELSGKVGLDTTGFKKGILDLNNELKHVETSFQASAAVMGDWGSTSDGVKMRTDSLTQKLEIQKKKLAILNEEYQKAVKEHGAGSKSAQSLAIQMYNCEKEIQSSEKSIKKYNAQLSEMGIISEKNAKKLIEAGNKISSVGSKMTMGVTAPLVAAGAAAYKASSDLTEAKNKVDATFGGSASTVQDWAKDSLNSFGMAKSTALDAVSLYGDMATSMGLGTGKAADMSKSLVELSADLSSFKNVSLSVSQTALKGIFTGETESLKNLGIVMTETQLKAYALSKGYEKNFEDMSQAEKVQLRYSYVLENSKNAIGDYARTSGEAAGQMRKLPEALKDLGSSFGENIAPTITPIIDGLNKMIQGFGGLDDSTKKTIVGTAAVAAAAGPILMVGGKTVTMVGKAIKVIKTLTTAKAATSAASVTAAATEEGLAVATDTAAASTKVLNTSLFATIGILSAITVAAGVFYSSMNKMSDEYDKSVDEEYDNRIEKSNSYHQNEIDRLENDKEAVTAANEKKITDTNKYYDNLIKQASEYEKSQKKALDNEKKILAKAHTERLNQLDAEKQAKLDVINLSDDTQTKALQAQIDALDAQTEAEEKANEEQENAQKLSDLKQSINSAKTYAEKVNAQKAYTEEVRRQEEAKTKSSREEQKKQLQDQINTIKEESNIKKQQINTEYESAKNLEDDKYTVQQEGIENRLQALDGYVESETERLEALQQSNLERMQNETTDYCAELQKRIDKEMELKKAAEDTLEAEKKTKKEDVTEETWYKSFKFDLGKMLNPANWSFGSSGGPMGGKPGRNASGTNNWRGGLTWVNENGGELMNLPRGTQIIPHDISMEAARAYGQQQAITNNNATTNNSYNYGAQQQVNVFKIGEEVVTTAIQSRVSVRESNKIYSRRRAGYAR